MSKIQLYWDTIKGAVKNPFFLMFLFSLFTIWANGGSNADIVLAVLGFVGVKTVVNLGTAVSTSDKDLSMLEHFFLSSRTWVAVFGVIFCYYTRMPTEMKEIIIAVAGGFGLDQIAVAIKGINFNRFVRPMSITVVPSTPTYMPPQQLSPPVVVEAPTAPPQTQAAPIPLLRDKLAVMREYYNKDKNYREYMLGGVNATIQKWLEHFVQVNPLATTVEIAKEIADKYFGRKLTAQECSTIQGILGLEAVIKSMGDIGILQGFFLAFDRFKELTFLERIFRDGTVCLYTTNTIEEASSRARSGNVDKAKAVLALQEFGLTAFESENSQWSGNMIKAIYRKVQGGQGFNYEDFNPYTLAGFTDIGQPL